MNGYGESVVTVDCCGAGGCWCGVNVMSAVAATTAKAIAPAAHAAITRTHFQLDDSDDSFSSTSHSS